MFLIIPGSLVLGFLFAEPLTPFVPLVPYLFAFVTLTMAIGCGLGEIRLAIARPLPVVWTIVIAHVLLPLLAYGIGAVTFGGQSPYTIGLVLFTLIPFGVSSVIWVGLSGGSVALMLCLVVLDSAISPALVPAGIHLIFGQGIEVDTSSIMMDLLLIVVLPTVIGVTLHELTRGRVQPVVKPYAAPLSKLCFVGVVLLNAVAVAPSVQQLSGDMLKLVPIVMLIVALCYLAGFIGTRLFGSRELTVTAAYATGMRNISLGVVLAMGYFSPLTTVPVMLAILIQQPGATLVHYIIGVRDKLTARQKLPAAGKDASS